MNDIFQTPNKGSSHGTKDTVGIAGVNLGFGFCKLVLDGQEDNFMSALTPLYQGVDSMPTRRAAPLNVTQDEEGRQYEVGVDGALSTTGEPMKALSRDWGRSKHYRLLMGAVLNRMAATGKRQWVICTGLAADHFRDAAYREEVVKLWGGVGGRHKTSHGEVEVLSVRILPEIAGGFFELISNREISALMRAGSGVVVDFGRMTVNWLPFKGGQTDANRLGSVDIGISDVIAEATKWVRAEACIPHLHELDVEAAMMGIRPIQKIVSGVGDKLMPLTVPLDISLTKAVAEVWPRVEQALSNKLGDLRGKLLIGIGGGTRVFGGHLRKSYPESTVLLPDDAQMANARGLYRLARLAVPRAQEATS